MVLLTKMVLCVLSLMSSTPLTASVSRLEVAETNFDRSIRGIPGYKPAPRVECISKYGTPSPEWLTVRLLTNAGWPPSQHQKLCRVIGCESNFRFNETSVHRGKTYYGLFQLQAYSWAKRWRELGYTDADMLTAEGNLAFGRWLFETLNTKKGTSEVWYSTRQGGWDCWNA